MGILQKGLWILVAILRALGAASCSTSTAAPRASHRNAQRIWMVRALLSPQSPPDCEYRAPDDAATLDPEVLARVKLEYERHCYQTGGDEGAEPTAPIAGEGVKFARVPADPASAAIPSLEGNSDPKDREAL
jgi:hypothetical protein